MLLKEGRHGSCNITFVKTIACRLQRGVATRTSILCFSFHEFLQGVCSIEVLEDLSSFGRPTIWPVDIHSRRILPNLFRPSDRTCKTLAQWKAFFRNFNGWLQDFRERHGAPTVEQDIPSINHGWD